MPYTDHKQYLNKMRSFWNCLFPAPLSVGLKSIPLLLVLFLSACTRVTSPTRTPPSIAAPQSTMAIDPGEADLPTHELQALQTLQKVDNYPLYIMTYKPVARTPAQYNIPDRFLFEFDRSEIRTLDWACSLFTAFGNAETGLFARNFDWRYSPALLLFYYPPGGYSSVTLVDLAYLFNEDEVIQLDKMNLIERAALLKSVDLPFDGMNSRGLMIGMAAVPYSRLPEQPDHETVGSLGIMRRILDQASDTDEALEILSSVNLDWGGGPPLHYLISDIRGQSVLVEFIDGEIVLLDQQETWHVATNFLQGTAAKQQDGQCWRYDLIQRDLEIHGGILSMDQAMDLLSRVAQEGSTSGTQWSVVYDNKQGEVQVVMGRNFIQPHVFEFKVDFP